MRIGLKNDNEIYCATIEEIAPGLKKFSKKVRKLDITFHIDNICSQTIQDVIASVEIEWRMIWETGEEKHWSCYNLAKSNRQWTIVGQLDRGIEINEKYKDFSLTKVKNENKENKEKLIEELIIRYINCLQNTDGDEFEKIWYEKAVRINLGNDNEILISSKEDIIKYTINGLKQARKEGFDVTHKFKEIKRLEVGDVTATAEIYWQMIMPDSTGLHTNYIHFAKDGNTWMIVGILDRGIEKIT